MAFEVNKQPKTRLQRRHRAERRFKGVALGALLAAAAFLVLFFGDIIS